MSLTFCTVIYGNDLAVWRLQARSIGRYVPADLLSDMVLILNERDPEALADLRLGVEAVIPEMGDCASKVQIIDGGDLLDVDVDVEGWQLQQIMKIRSHRIARTDKIVILDAKNHFVRPIQMADFFCEATGRPKMYFRKRHPHQVQHKWIVESLRVFGMDESLADRPNVTTITPFPALRSTLADMDNLIAERHGSFEAMFSAQRSFATEFFMLSAVIQHRHGKLDRYFSTGMAPPITLFPGIPDTPEAAIELIRRASEGESHTFSLHSRRIENIDQAEALALVDLWVAHDLAKDDEAARILRMPLPSMANG